jgi:hypothetical protein
MFLKKPLKFENKGVETKFQLDARNHPVEVQSTKSELSRRLTGKYQVLDVTHDSKPTPQSKTTTKTNTHAQRHSKGEKKPKQRQTPL